MISNVGTTAKDLVKDAAGWLADMAAGVVHQILPVSSDAEDANQKTGKPKRDKDDNGLSKH